MKAENRKQIAALLNKQSQDLITQAHRLAALSDAINPETPDEGDDSVLAQIANIADKIEDSPLGLIPQVRLATEAVDAAGDLAGLIGKIFK